jgi:hypothetical protein
VRGLIRERFNYGDQWNCAAVRDRKVRALWNVAPIDMAYARFDRGPVGKFGAM